MSFPKRFRSPCSSASRRSQNARVLGDHVTATSINNLRQSGAVLLELFKRNVAQRSHIRIKLRQVLHTCFTLRATLIVSARSQLVLHHRVANYQTNIVGQRQQPEFKRAAIQQQSFVRLAEKRNKLVHDADARTHKLVFRPLTQTRELTACRRANPNERPARRQSRPRPPRTSSTLIQSALLRGCEALLHANGNQLVRASTATPIG